MHKRGDKRAFFVIIGVLCVLALNRCSDSSQAPAVHIGEELIVLTRNAPTTYYEDRHGELAGFEYDLVSRFARTLNVRVRFEDLDSVEQIFSALDSGQGHIAAAGLTKTESRVEEFLAGPEYYQVEERIVCHEETNVQKIEDLIDHDILVVAGSSYEETLRTLKQDFPNLTWSVTSTLSSEQLLKRVWEGRIDCTVADSNVVSISRRYLPELESPFPISGTRSLVWYLPKNAGPLHEALTTWLERFKETGRLAALADKYYGHLREFDYYDTKVFYKRLERRLPQLKPIFMKAEERYGIPWRLLAAMAYQESHWNPAATSRTGVRGVMMLTQTTANSLGVSNRLDPTESILGGAEYLRKLMDRMPPFIEQPDRLFMAMAAYNVGFAHLQDARKLAIDLGRNPNKWHDLKTILPFLSKRKYYRNLRHGYARGYEPLIYVQRIRHYHDLLAQETSPHVSVEKEQARSATEEEAQPEALTPASLDES